MIDVLVVDSVQAHIDEFAKYFKGLTTVYVPSAAHAIYHLMSTAPQLLFLEYELGIPGFNAQEQGNGVMIAAWLGEHAEKFSNTNIIVHTNDSWGSERIISILKRNNLTWYEHTDVWSNSRVMRALASTVEKTR